MTNPPQRPVSGTLVILGIAALALVAAGTSWIYRYAATYKTARFWGASWTQSIRDAPVVELYHYAGDDMLSDGRDVSNAPGLTHMRHALLENRSFEWPARPIVQQPRWRWALAFREKEDGGIKVLILFTEDCRTAAMYQSTVDKVISCEPISGGLCEMFDEMAANYKPSR